MHFLRSRDTIFCLLSYLVRKRPFKTPLPLLCGSKIILSRKGTEHKIYCILPSKETLLSFSLSSAAIYGTRPLSAGAERSSFIPFSRQHTLLYNWRCHRFTFTDKRYWTMLLRMPFLHFFPSTQLQRSFSLALLPLLRDLSFSTLIVIHSIYFITIFIEINKINTIDIYSILFLTIKNTKKPNERLEFL
jgi:hypothetical protein